MSTTTFSGPVASQNGFVTATYTSTTLPYYTPGNIVFVSDLNTLAFGGADQWYDQRTGQGLGTGGGVTPPGPVETTYVVGTNYSYASFNGMGTFAPLYVTGMDTKMTTAFGDLVVGDTITATYDTPTQTATLTIATPPVFVGPSPKDWQVDVNSDVQLTGTGFDSLTF